MYIIKEKCFINLFSGDYLKDENSKEKDKVEAIGFSLLAAILNNNPKNADDLHKWFVL